MTVQHRRQLIALGAAFIVALLTGIEAAAQSPTITAAPSSIAAGPDYATDLRADPWDFSNQEDLSPFPDEMAGWTITGTTARTVGRSAFLSNGTFAARTALGGGNIIPLLFRGGFNFVTSTTEKTGKIDAYAIPTARYGKVALRIHHSQATSLSSQLAAYWYDNVYGRERARGVGFSNPLGGDRIYLVDLVTGIWTDTRGNPVQTPAFLPVGGFTQIPWNEAPRMRGFQLLATSDGNSQVDVTVDWVRLTARDSQLADSAKLPITFSGCASSDYNIEVETSPGMWNIIHTGTVTGGGGTALVNHGVLPPGTWNLRVTCFQINRTPTGGNALSSTPRAVTILAPPMVTVLEPNAAGDVDFASHVLRNPWDMSSLSDALRVSGVTAGSAQIVFDQVSTGELRAINDNTGDPQVLLYSPVLGNNSTATAPLLSSRRYRHLTFTAVLEGAFGLREDQNEGSVARILWGSQGNEASNTMSVTQDILLWPGRNTYTVDLGSLTLDNGGLETECVNEPGVNCPQIPWAQRSLRFFRVDPHEARLSLPFRLHDVKLTAYDEVALDGSTYNVRYSITDPESAGSSYQATIYADTDQDPTNGLGTQIGLANGTPIGPQLLRFNPSDRGLLAGLYYIYTEVRKIFGSTTMTRGSYSNGPLRVYEAGTSSPVVSVSSPTANQRVLLPFNVTGCAYDQGNSDGINMDDLAVYAVVRNVPNLSPGFTRTLGFGRELGTLSYQPLTPATPVVCAAISNANSPFRNAGFTITNIQGLEPGDWTIRVFARSTISDDFATLVGDLPITVSGSTGIPQNVRVSGQRVGATRNRLTLAWDAPTGGPPFDRYQIDISTAGDANFTRPLLAQVIVPASVTTGSDTVAFGSGTYYFRVRTLNPSGVPGENSETVSISLPIGVRPPSTPVLTLTQVTSNPITLSWGPGSGGGTPESYTLIAGTTPTGSELGIFPMGTLTTITATAPVGVRIYVRVQALNEAGEATTTAREFELRAPTAPGAPTLAPPVKTGTNVSFSWTPPTTGGTPTGYELLARLSPNGNIIAALAVSGTSFQVTSVPAGTYYVTVVGVNAAGRGAESNQFQLTVP